MTRKEIREEFWKTHPSLEAEALRSRMKTASHNMHETTTRVAFTDFIDYLEKEGLITKKMVFYATL